MVVPDKIPVQKSLETQAESMLQHSPAIVKVPMPKGAFILAQPENALPAELDIDLQHVEFFNADIQSVLFSIAKQKTKVNFIYEAPRYPGLTQNFSRSFEKVETPVSVAGASNINEQTIAKQDRQKIISISFDGKLSSFLKALQDASGYFFRYDPTSKSIVVKDTDTFNFTIPNYTTFQKEKNIVGKGFTLQEEIESNLKSIGARDISYDTFTSTLSFTSDANGLRRVKAYLQSLRDNAALVTMQVMLLEVNLSETQNAGIDWSKLVVGYKSQAENPFGIAAQNQNTTTASTTSGTSTATTSPLTTGIGALFNNTGAQLFVEARNFSLSMLLNFLEQYGHYSIAQNIRVESMSGTKGKFKVLTETPYVSEVQFTALSQQSTSATAGFKSSTAKSGVEVEIVPYYNKAEGSLSMALRVDVSGVTQMVTLQAGSQFGTINQPETTIKSLEDFLRIAPEHIAIIGGLTYEKLNNNSSGLPGESYVSKTYQRSLQKNELVLVVKPTIYEFE